MDEIQFLYSQNERLSADRQQLEELLSFEPERTRAAVVKALRDAADLWYGETGPKHPLSAVTWLYNRAEEIEGTEPTSPNVDDLYLDKLDRLLDRAEQAEAERDEAHEESKKLNSKLQKIRDLLNADHQEEPGYSVSALQVHIPKVQEFVGALWKSLDDQPDPVS